MRILLLALLASLLLAGCRTSEPLPDVATVNLTLQEGHDPFVQFFAYRDGDGAWTELDAADGAYRFEVTDEGGRYGVAVVCNRPDIDPHLLQNILGKERDEEGNLKLTWVSNLVQEATGAAA